MLLGDMDITYDDVGNPIELRDWRDPEEWPAGSKPVTRKIEYDDLNRVSNLTYEYAPGDEAASDDEASDTWVSPFNRENTDPTGDARRSMPAPHISFPKRVQSQSYKYDWLGNIVETDDDAHGFYDRSLGTATHDSSRPYRLQSANNSAQAPSGSGQASVKYDAAGNVTYVTVLRTGTCLPTTVGNCNQQYRYEWDEVGHLVRARRWDSVTTAQLNAPATGPVAVDLRYRYDASDQRVLKRSYVSTLSSRTTVSIFDSLELRRSNFSTTTQDYALTSSSNTVVHEVAYLVSNGVRLARLGHETAGEVPEVSGDQGQGETNTLATLHVLLELGDHLGSTNLVVDKATGELVEAATYLPTGSRESDYRPDRWDGFREEYGFTGKEEDVEVGLIYFGKRYLNPGLGRWVSPDPLAVHVPGEADFNLYAYVSGALLKSVDPVGLSDADMPQMKEDNLISNMTAGGSTTCEGLSCYEAKMNGDAAEWADPPGRTSPIPAAAEMKPGETHDKAAASGAKDTAIDVLKGAVTTFGGSAHPAAAAGLVAQPVEGWGEALESLRDPEMSPPMEMWRQEHRAGSGALVAGLTLAGPKLAMGPSRAGTLAGEVQQTERLATVTSWADRGVKPDLNPGRWVQLGEATRWNFLKTGLPGPKAHASESFPFIRLEASKVPFTNSITAEVPAARLQWPPSLEAWKGILGQRVLRP